MDRDPSANHIDPIERELRSTGDNDTGEVGAKASRVMEERHSSGTANEQAHKPVQTKKTPRP